jgi:hypothetical protein
MNAPFLGDVVMAVVRPDAVPPRHETPFNLIFEARP